MKSLLAYRDVWLLGGGGKTTLMYQLADSWAARGESVICTTTTRIVPPTREQCLDFRLGEPAEIVAGLRAGPARKVTAAHSVADGKCVGYSALDAMALLAAADHLVVEADGAAGKPLKAHAPYEPVIADAASCVVAVVGGWCVGARLDAQHVHRPERFAALSGRPLGERVSAEDVANVILHEEGWLRAVPDSADFHVVVTGRDPGIIQALARHAEAGRVSGTAVSTSSSTSS